MYKKLTQQWTVTEWCIANIN